MRRNTQNTEADQTDLARIVEWGQIQREPSFDSGTPSGAWEQLYRACDDFDPGRIYIAVLDREPGADMRDWTAMAGIHWNIIVDFDTRTDTDGNFAVARGPFSERQALQLSALEGSVTMTRRSTVWVAAAGLESRPTTNPSGNWRDWNRSKVPQLERTISDLATITEPSPVTLVAFGGEANYVSATCEIVDRAFAHRVDYVFTNPEFNQYREIAEGFDASTVTINLAEVCQGLRELQPDSGLIEEPLFPKLNGGTAVIAPDRARWMEEQFELVHWDAGLRADEQTDGDLFLNPNPPMRSGLGVRTRGEGRGARRSALDSDKWGRWRPLVVVGGADVGPGQRRWGGVGGTVCRGRQLRTGPVRRCGAVGYSGGRVIHH